MNRMILLGVLILSLLSAAYKNAGGDAGASAGSLAGVWKDRETGSVITLHEDGSADIRIKSGSGASGELAFAVPWKQEGDIVVFSAPDAPLSDWRVEVIDGEEVLTDGTDIFHREAS